MPLRAAPSTLGEGLELVKLRDALQDFLTVAALALDLGERLRALARACHFGCLVTGEPREILTRLVLGTLATLGGSSREQGGSEQRQRTLNP